MGVSAETALVLAVSTAEELPPGAVSFFPLESTPEARLVPADVQRLFWEPSDFYRRLASAVAARAAAETGIPAAAAEALARDAGVLAGYLFLDRALRWQRLVERTPAPRLAAPRAQAPDVRADALKLLAASGGSRGFNQALVAELAPAWGVRVIDPTSPESSSPAVPPAAVRNYNFSPVGLPRRVLRRLARDGGKVLGRVPSGDLAYASDYLLDAWVVGPGRLSPVSPRLPPVPVADEPLRRRVLAGAAEDVAGALAALLEGWGVRDARAAAALFAPYLVRVWPAPLLEGAPGGLAACRDALRRFGPRPLLFSSTGGVRTSLLLAAARAEGLPTVGIQHAVHYGFARAPVYTELEYAHCDRFVTWGWTRLSAHPIHDRVRTAPLPSPWLSERRREWAADPPRRGAPRAADLLLMTDKFHGFPLTAGTNRLSRNDSLGDSTADLRRLVDSLVAARFTVLHKPFDRVSAAAQGAVVGELARRHAGSYRLQERLDKGLMRDLVESCGLVLWDEPGTGYFECLTSGIPTMLYWPRYYSSEEDFARPAFEKLEAAGLAHRTVGALVAALEDFRARPDAWAREPARREAAEAVCREYAWADDSWGPRWRAFVDSLV
jgi:hypothetical protein